MALDINQVIKGPRVSNKAHRANKELNQLVLEVHPAANKPAIKQAVQQRFNVKVEKIRTHILKKKRSKGTNKGRRVSDPSIKKVKIAHVSLAEGHELSFLDQMAAPTTFENREE
jgi:large subunit ribosomal protein L23